MTNALEVKDLTKRYSGFTLDKVSFALPSGCIMGFIGENGAGKSTTIKLILDLIHRDGGSVSVLGRDHIADDRELKEQIGVVLDESSFPENLSAQNISELMSSCYRSWDSARFADYCGRFSLAMSMPVKDYSRGMKMKLSIAVALSHNSRLLILDEATGGLDPIVRDEILDVFLEFIQDEGHSIFISSHIISDLEKICDYITFIHKGRIVFSEEKDALKEKYAVAHLGSGQLAELEPCAVVGSRTGRFGTDALVLRGQVPAGIQCDPASIEDIMLYFVKEDAR